MKWIAVPAVLAAAAALAAAPQAGRKAAAPQVPKRLVDLTHAFGANGASLFGGCGFEQPGMQAATVRPAVTAAPLFRNSRRGLEFGCCIVTSAVSSVVQSFV